MALATQKIKPFILPLSILLVAALIASWFVASRPRAMPKAVDEQIWPVAMVTASARDEQPEIVVYGEIRAAREAEIRTMVSGRLASINPDFKDGNRLEGGTELATLNPVDYRNRLAEQRSELARSSALLEEYRAEIVWEQQLEANAQRQVELAKRALDRSEKLQKSGRESRKARDDADATLAQNQQNLLQRSQALGRLRSKLDQQQAAHAKTQATLAMAEEELARTHIIAPFNGYVTDVSLALGKVLAAGESLGRLLSADDLEVRFDLPEAEFSRLLTNPQGSDPTTITTLIGREISLIWRLGDSERRFPARIARIGAEIDATLGGIEVTAAVDPEALMTGLRVGAFVEVHVPDLVYREVFRLPSRAVIDDRFIYAVEESRLVRVEVDVLRTIGDDVLVRGEINDGARIVARTFAGIGPGLKVREL